MTDSKPSKPTQNAITPVMYWGTLALDILVMVTLGGILRTTAQLPGTIVTNVAMVMLVLALMAGVLIIVLTLRGRQPLAAQIVFFVSAVAFGTTIIIYSGRIYTTISTLLFLSTIIISQILPKTKRRTYIGITAVIVLLLTAVELISPSWRISTEAEQFGTVSAVAFGLTLAIILVSLIRQAMIGNILTKLIVAFVLIIVLGVGFSGWLGQRAYRISLTDNIGDKLAGFADLNGTEIAIALDREFNILKTLSLSKDIQNAALAANETSTLSQAEIDRLDQRWRAADAAENNRDPLVAEVLNDPISAELQSFRSQFNQHVEVFLTGTQGFSIASTNRTSDYNQADEEWWQTAYGLGQYIGQPEYDDSSKTIAINMAVAVRENGDGRVLGVLRTTVNFTALDSVLSAGLFGQTGRTVILLPSDQMLFLKDTGGGILELVQEETPSELLALSQILNTSRYRSVSLYGVPVLVSIARVKMIGVAEGVRPVVGNLKWHVVTLQDEAEALQPVTVQARSAIFLGVGIMLLGIITAFFVSRAISGPVIRLNATAQKIAGGDLTVDAKVETRDEIGTLAATFNNMVAQLRDLIGSLEGRVAARTQDLAIVAEVGTATATILETDKLLQAVVELTKERFNLYHSHIYLLDQAGENLVLASGAGEPGRQMKAKGLSIPLDREQSLVARAARERKGVTVNDVTQAPDFLPNPLLPDTRSELAVPMIVGGKVIGVFDVQSDQVGRFTDSDINIQTTLAAQVATSVQNVRSFEQSKSQAELEFLINTIGQKIQLTTSVDGVLQTAVREIGLALGAERVSVNIGTSRQHDGEEASRN